MTEETKDAEVVTEPSKKLTPAQKAAKTKAANKLKTARVVKTRTEAINILMEMNVPFDQKADDIALIAIAEQIPVEKWYKIEIQTRDEFATKQAFCKVNGKSWRLERGVEHKVPARVVAAFRNAVSKTVDMIDTVNGKKIVERERRNEMISILGETSAP